MPDESQDTHTTNVSGGVNADVQGGSMEVGGDVVGHDNISSTTVNIEHYHAAPVSDAPSTATPQAKHVSALPGDPTPLARASGSPFVVGRPLNPNEPIFGRDDVYHIIVPLVAEFVCRRTIV